MISVMVPIQTVSEMNRRDHWAKRHRRSREQKDLVTLMLRTAKFDRTRLVAPFVVKMTRVSPGAIKDSDNLAASTKAARDAIAAFLGVDDADLLGAGQVQWIVAQERGKAYGLRIEIDSRGCQQAESPVI